VGKKGAAAEPTGRLDIGRVFGKSVDWLLTGEEKE